MFIVFGFGFDQNQFNKNTFFKLTTDLDYFVVTEVLYFL